MTREKICFAFYAVFLAFWVRFFQFFRLCVALLVSGAILCKRLSFLSFSPKKTKNEHFFTQRRGQEESKSSFDDELFSLVLFALHKKKKRTQKMNVLSTHAVALHGMNARGSQRTPSASTASLKKRKNTTRSYNTKKNINAARHRRQRSIIRYARQ